MNEENYPWLERYVRTVVGRFPAARRVVVGFYTSYFDAAGRQDSQLEPDFISVAGIVATERRWAKLERRWNKTLRTFDLKHVHTSDLFFGKGEFKDWPRSHNRVQRLFDKLASLLADEMSYGRHDGAVLKDFWRAYEEEDFIRKAAGHDRHSLAGPYSAYGAICATGVQRWYEKQRRLEGHGRIHHFFEKGDLGWGALQSNFSMMYGDANMPRVEAKLDPATGLFKVPFQATDFFAWHARRYWLAGIRDERPDWTHALRTIIRAFPDRRTHSYKELKALAADWEAGRRHKEQE